MRARQPGIYFHTAAVAKATDLPRMDVAGFVGFAGSGPLHTPVLIEEMAQYRDVFGDDVELAWDSELKQMQYSLLGSSVNAFFRNGGERCWVVRVAAENAQLAHFEIPGLYYAKDGQAATINARSPGSWAENIRLTARLQIKSLAADSSALSASPDRGILSKNGGKYHLRVRSAPANLQIGDLLEIRCSSESVSAYIFIQDRQIDETGLLLISDEVYWFETAQLLPPYISSPDQLLPLDETEAWGRYEAFIATCPEQMPAIRWLRFDLLVWRGDALHSQLNELAFHPKHKRFWGQLPNDKELYGQFLYANPVTLEPAINQFLSDIVNPRFALASGLDDDQKQYPFLPLRMGISSLPDTATAPVYGDGLSSASPRYIRDGLGSFNADLFLDTALASLKISSLLKEANYLRFVQQRSLKGIYSLLAIDEISMLAAPDMVHRHWNMDAPEFDPPLQAPILKEITEADAYGVWKLNWSPVNNARRYIVQQSLAADFEKVIEHHIERPAPLALNSDHKWPEAPDALLKLLFKEACSQYWFFRVRAEAHAQFSPWSNTEVLRQPPASFYDCKRAAPALLRLQLKRDVISPHNSMLALSWKPEDGDSWAGDLVTSYQLQCATDMDFISADTIYPSDDEVAPYTDTNIELPFLTDTVAYFRIRAISGDVTGPWSNTLETNPERVSVQTLNEVDSYQDQDLKAVQFALIRLCAAKADTLAILTLPAHYQDAQASAAVDELIPRPISENSVAPGLGSGKYSVPGLNTAEYSALSYAAFYFPWLRTSVDEKSSDENSLIPPIGAVCGKLAATANQRGAWVASENKSLQDVLGLGYRFTDQAQLNLADKQINMICESPKGFIVSRANTLSHNSELKPLNVRRLMLLLRRLAMREGGIYLFESNSVDFRNRVQHYWEMLLNNLYQRGAFCGNSAEAAYRVVTDESVNDRRSLELGRFVVELQVAPSQPMSFIHIRLIQSGSDQLLFQEL